MMEFLRSRWYAAALADEVEQVELLARTLLGEPVIVFRNAVGTVSILADRCPHRFAPLSEGRIKGGVIACPYHGLRFNASGACVHNPRGDGKIGDRLEVKSYPVFERHGVIWFWPGDPEEADPETLPDFSFIDQAEPFRLATGYMHTRAEYDIILDNLLDATHADYVHPTLLTSGGAFETVLPKVERGEDSVAAVFEFGNFPAQPAFAQYLPDPEAPAEQRASFRWIAPAHVHITSEAWQDLEPESVVWTRSLHTVTPETHRTSHYWFLSNSNAGEASAERLQVRRAALIRAFTTEDKPMLEKVSARMAGRDFWQMEPAILAGDGASVIMRRNLASMLRGEKSAC